MNMISGEQQEAIELKEKTQKMLLYVGIISIIMMFAGLTSGYIVSIGAGTWLKISLPYQFSFSTAVMLVSSITINAALIAAKKGQANKIGLWLGITLLLGLLFALLQYQAWNKLYDNKIYFAGKSSNAAGSFLYVITGLHLAHLIGGLLFLLNCLYKNSRGKITEGSHLIIKLCATYWHFLDILWLYLFFFLLYFR